MNSSGFPVNSRGIPYEISRNPYEVIEGRYTHTLDGNYLLLLRIPGVPRDHRLDFLELPQNPFQHSWLSQASSLAQRSFLLESPELRELLKGHVQNPFTQVTSNEL